MGSKELIVTRTSVKGYPKLLRRRKRRTTTALHTDSLWLEEYRLRTPSRGRHIQIFSLPSKWVQRNPDDPLTWTQSSTPVTGDGVLKSPFKRDVINPRTRLSPVDSVGGVRTRVTSRRPHHRPPSHSSRMRPLSLVRLLDLEPVFTGRTICHSDFRTSRIRTGCGGSSTTLSSHDSAHSSGTRTVGGERL